MTNYYNSMAGLSTRCTGLLLTSVLLAQMGLLALPVVLSKQDTSFTIDVIPGKAQKARLCEPGVYMPDHLAVAQAHAQTFVRKPHLSSRAVHALAAGLKQVKHLLSGRGAAAAAPAAGLEQCTNGTVAAAERPYRMVTLHEEARIFLLEGFLSDGAERRGGAGLRPASASFAYSLSHNPSSGRAAALSYQHKKTSPACQPQILQSPHCHNHNRSGVRPRDPAGQAPHGAQRGGGPAERGHHAERHPHQLRHLPGPRRGRRHPGCALWQECPNGAAAPHCPQMQCPLVPLQLSRAEQSLRSLLPPTPLAAIERRIADLTLLPMGNGEALQVPECSSGSRAYSMTWFMR